MRFDLMVGATTWAASAQLARDVEAQGFSGMLFTETSQTPWMSIAAAATAAPDARVHAPASPSPSPAARWSPPRLAWELAENTGGRFRLGLGSQVQAHVERRYGTDFDPPGPRMRDYVQAVQACLRGVPGRGAPRPRRAVLQADACCRRSGRPAATPTATSRSTSRRSAPGCAAWPARWPTASTCTPSTRCPTCRTGCSRRWPRARPGRAATRPTSTSSSRCSPSPATPPRSGRRCSSGPGRQIAFYGSHQELRLPVRRPRLRGHVGRLNDLLKAGDLAAAWPRPSPTRCSSTTPSWRRGTTWPTRSSTATGGTAARLVMYLAEESIRRDAGHARPLGRGGAGRSPPPDRRHQPPSLTLLSSRRYRPPSCP